MKNKSFFERLGFAVRGLLRVWQKERSFRTQLAFAILVVALAMVLPLTPLWWAVLLTVVSLVLVLEVVNSAVELLCDQVRPEYSESIRDIKDMMAAAVLIAALVSIFVGACLVWSYQTELFNLF